MILRSVIVVLLFAMFVFGVNKRFTPKINKVHEKRLNPVPFSGGTFHSVMGGTFETAAGGTFETDMPGTFHSATGGTFVPVLGGTFNPLLSPNRDSKEALRADG